MNSEYVSNVTSQFHVRDKNGQKLRAKHKVQYVSKYQAQARKMKQN
jgi:hypothetical protein